MTTPGVHTGDGVPAATAAPLATATPSTTATPAPARKAVTSAERQVIQGWADSLRLNRISAAARYFSVPSRIVDSSTEVFLSTQAEVEKFNRSLTCGAKLVRTRPGMDGFVVGIFELTERKGQSKCGTGVGETTAVAFQIRKRHIQQWVRIDLADVEPTPTPTPKPSATPGSS